MVSIVILLLICVRMILLCILLRILVLGGMILLCRFLVFVILFGGLRLVILVLSVEFVRVAVFFGSCYWDVWYRVVLGCM